METVPELTDFTWRQALVIVLMGGGFSQKEVAQMLGPTEKTIRSMTKQRGLQWPAHHGRRGPLPEIPEVVKQFLAYVRLVESRLPHKHPPDTPHVPSARVPSSPNLSYTSLPPTNGDGPLHFEI